MTTASNSNDQQTLIRLRSDLVASLRRLSGESCFVVEDPLNGVFFRMGAVEWGFAQRLDGRTTLKQAHEWTAQKFGGDAFSPAAAQHMTQWLVANGLTHTANIGRAAPRLKWSAAKLVSNAFFLRVPLLQPDRFLTRIHPWLGWCFCRGLLLVWLVLLLAGVRVLVTQASRFWDSAAVYLSPSSWLVVFLIWFTLKVVHEFFHGLACKHFGGNVASCGIALILFSPIAYVDVSSAWRFQSKWHRIVTSAAGLYIELAIASIAALVWAHTTSPQTAFVCHAIVTTAGISSILFNANPLMRYDAYYIVSDLLEIQNLYGEGQAAVRVATRKWLFGLTTQSNTTTHKMRRFVLAYGIATGIWRTIISLSLILAAAKLFHGAGLVLSLAAVIIWYGLPAVSLLRYLVQGDERDSPRPIRFLGSVGVLVLLLGVLLCCPIPGGVRAPAIVEFEPLHDLRAESSGFVQSVFVHAGDCVQEGQTLVVLRNDELAVELQLAATEIQQSVVRMRILRDQGRVAEYQAEVNQHAVAVQRHDVLKHRADRLVITAPATGVVLTLRPQELLGKYVHAGESLVSIAAESSKEIKVSIAESHVESFLEHVGLAAHVYLRGESGSVGPATLVRIDPSATDILRQPLLGAQNGGPLAVQTTDSDAAGPSIRLAAPRFQGIVRVPPDVARHLHAGQLGEVRFSNNSENLGRRLYQWADKWIRRRI